MSNRFTIFVIIFYPLLLVFGRHLSWMHAAIPNSIMVTGLVFWFYCLASMVISFGVIFGSIKKSNEGQMLVLKLTYFLLTKEAKSVATSIFKNIEMK